VLHLGEVALHAGRALVRLGQGELELQAGQGVRRSWLTEARSAVRWSIWRWMRWRMARKAAAAWRTSRAPCGFEGGRVAAATEGVGRLGQVLDGAHLVADEEDRDGG